MTVQQPEQLERVRSITSDASHTLTLVATSLGFVVVQLDVTIVNVALQRIGDSFGARVAELQWVVDAYTIAFASLILTAGALGDRLGVKRIFTSGFFLFTLASAACGAAVSMPMLIASRAVQGIGAALLVPCSLAILNHTYRDEASRAKAVALWAFGASLALAAGPVLGGVLVNSIGWRSIFFINLPIGALGIWLTSRYAAESQACRARGLDSGGQITIILALGTMAAATIESSRFGISNPLVIAGFTGFALAAGLFVGIEAKGQNPMLPLSFFRNPTFSAAILVGLLINISYYGLIFLFSLFFQQAQHYSPFATGLAFLPMTAGVIITNFMAGRITARTGPRLPMLIGQALFAAGCLSLVTITPNTAFTYMWWQLLLMGAGIGLVVPPMTSAVLGAIERHQSGVASGALNATRQAGSVIGVAVYGALIADKNQFARGAQIALYLSAAFLLFGCLATYRYVANTSPSRGETAQRGPDYRPVGKE
ncbi:MAG: MFS transporter [Verrucomicrobia bacterium]|nr:MFS transporter [Verrucomicrobiota bacterium]MBV8485745.1 MFS transporter [Verrucomicrobiota bacterium]